MKTVDARPELLYHGKLMDPEPTGTMSLKAAAILLAAGNAVGVELQPGDGTAYRLLLAPAWIPIYRDASGGGVGDGAGYLIVSLFNLGTMYPLRRHAVPTYIAEHMKITNAWTATFLAWWLDQLWAEMDDVLAEEHGR